MNRRGRGTTKKIEFEPRIPEAASAVDLPVETETKPAEREMMQSMRGLFAPNTFSTPRPFDIASDGFIMSLPAALLDSSLVVFSDGSLGIRKDGFVYECDSGFLGDGVAVEIKEKIRKIGDTDFIITGYAAEKQ